jgi:ribonuclease P protein component
VTRDNEISPVRFAVSVPKKKTPLSVHRQRIKRLIREAWRLNKHLLYNVLPAEIQLHVFFMFTNKGLPDYSEIEASMLHIINQLMLQVQSDTDA